MAHWLMKSEPGSYSWDQLVRDRRPNGTASAIPPRGCTSRR